MPHTHPVICNDLYFSIDTLTREITNGSNKVKIMQGDHASEIFTFEIPRYVDGHDMSLCNKIAVHYINVGTSGSNADVNIITDATINDTEDKVIFSWTIYRTATKYAGTLNFLIKFSCVEEDGTISYQWNTDIFKGITISAGMNNEETIVEDYYDILQTWRDEIVSEMRSEIAPLRTGITRVESLDAENIVQLRDLETGLYVLYGYFSPYTYSHITMTFDNTMVVVTKKTAGSHLLVFTGTNSKVNFLEIMADSEAPAGYTYTRTDFVMLDMHNLIEKVGELADLNTEEKSNIVSAINEINNTHSYQINQLKEYLAQIYVHVSSSEMVEENKLTVYGGTLDGNLFTGSGSVAGFLGLTVGRRYKVVVVPTKAGYYTMAFSTKYSFNNAPFVFKSTYIAENTPYVADITSDMDWSDSPYLTMRVSAGGSMAIPTYWYIYDVTGIDESILSKMDFSKHSNPVEYYAQNVPLEVINDGVIKLNILYGKNATFMGDSLTGSGSGGHYIDYIADGLGLSATQNCGIGGTRVSGGDAGGTSFWTDTRVNSFSLDSDVLFIMGGTNDAPYTTVSEEDFTIDNYNTDNFVGAYNVLISKVLYKYLKLGSGYYDGIDYSGVTQVEMAKPYFRIILITPPKRFDSASNLKKVEQFADYVKRIGALWGLPVIDTNGQMNMNIINKANYWTHQTSPDWVHFDVNGHKELANIIIGKVKSLN